MPRLLIVSAVDAERDAVLGTRTPAAGELAGLPVLRCATPAGLVDLASVGVGPVAAALTTAALLAAARYDLVVSAGIGGGFLPADLGSTVVADALVQADLGAQTADGGFSSLAELGLGRTRLDVDPALAGLLASRTGGQLGAVLTVSTVTGTAERAARLATEHPGALAEAMEGAGVGMAAVRAGVAFAEVRTISNQVGPRDRASWQLGPALAALTTAFDRVLAEPLPPIGERS